MKKKMSRAEQARETKILGYVERYFDALLEQEEKSMLTLLRQHSTREVATWIQKQEFEFQRTKLAVIEAAVQSIYKDLRQKAREAEEHEQQQQQQDQIDSDFEGVDQSTLMEVKDQNNLNKGVVGLWGVPAASREDTPADDKQTADEKEKEKDKPNDKKRGRKDGKEPKAKRQKVEERKSNMSVTLNDLGGINDVISQVLELIVMPMARADIYQHIGCDIPRGVLLHGPPGCGKTVLANALANEIGVPFISVSAPSVVSGMSGESEKKLRDLFEEAKSLAPCLVFLDEIDAITPKRESVQREMERRIVAQLLTSMDSLSLEQTGGKPVMVIGATNRPDSIDPALRRGGRFDAEICMNVPDQESREQILKTITSKLKLEGDFDFTKLAKSTPGYVGADLQALVAAAGARAIKRIFHDDMHGSGSGSGTGAGAESDNEMQIDKDDDGVEPEKVNEVTRFLRRHPEPLTAEQLAPLAVTNQDFETALPTVQPSSKREGFTTVPDVTWADVGAMRAIREELEFAIVEPIKNPELYLQIGVTAPSGVLLWGPPGCGKTLLAKAVANESQANFISVRGPELLNKFVGESERAVRQVFVRARASKPCVIFFDELDALVPRRDDVNSEASSRVVNTLLTELDGVGDRNGVYVIGATNRRDMVDPAMMRPGRLDKQLFVELPTAEERLEILKTVSRKSPLEASVSLLAIAHDERCRNFSGADLSALTREASVAALKRQLQARKDLGPSAHGMDFTVTVTVEDFEQAFNKVKPSVSDEEREKYKLMNMD